MSVIIKFKFRIKQIDLQVLTLEVCLSISFIIGWRNMNFMGQNQDGKLELSKDKTVFLRLR